MSETESQLSIKESLFSGEEIIQRTDLQNSAGEKVTLHAEIIDQQWLAITASAGSRDIGIADIRLDIEENSAMISAPHINSTGLIDESDHHHLTIRNLAKENGLFVSRSERGRKIGEKMLEWAKELLRELNIKKFQIDQPSDRSYTLYERVGGVRNRHGYLIEM